jgi:hypothetical protein
VAFKELSRIFPKVSKFVRSKFFVIFLYNLFIGSRTYSDIPISFLTQEGEVGGLSIQSQSGLHSEALSQKAKFLKYRKMDRDQIQIRVYFSVSTFLSLLPVLHTAFILPGSHLMGVKSERELTSLSHSQESVAQLPSGPQDHLCG